MERLTQYGILAGRLLLAVLFAAGAVQKGVAPEGAQSLLASLGWPVWLVWPATAFNVAGALALVFGVWLAPMALALAFYCMVTSLFHYLPDDPWQMSIFIKNWAIAGGLLVLAGHEAQNPRG